MTSPRPRLQAATGEAGLTLIEIMIAVLLLAILSIGALTALSGQQATAIVQAHDDNLLANARGALGIIAKQLRMSLVGATQGATVVVNLASTRPQGSTYQYTCPGGSAVDVAPDLTSGKVPVINVVNCSTASAGNQNLATDALTILFPDGANWGVLSSDATSATVMQVRTANNTLADLSTLLNGDWVLLTNFTSGVVSKLTSAPATATVGSCTADLCLSKATGDATYPATYGKGSLVTRAGWLLYSVSRSYFGSDQPALEVKDLASGTAQPGAVDIDDFQVALGIDKNADGVLAAEVGLSANDDEWVYNYPGDTAPTTADLANLRAVRVTIVARAVGQPGGVQAHPPSVEDHDRSGEPLTTDHFVRLSETIALRNQDQQ